MNTDKYIGRYIVKAQIASDAGKGIDEISTTYKSTEKGPLEMGYDVKPILIANAIKLIRSTKKSCFNYYVVKAADQNGFSSILVYFDWRNPVDGKRYQVSFHNPWNKSDILFPYIDTGRKTHWRKSTSSRLTCMKMIEAYNF